MDIAIIGMSGRYSDIGNIYGFWNKVKEGRNMVIDFPAKRKLDTEDYLDFINFPEENRTYERGSYLDEIDKFDYKFFHISPREASLIDPNHRIILEEAYKAINDSGYKLKDFEDLNVGTYIGLPTDAFYRGYGHAISQTNMQSLSIAFAGNLPSMTAGRIAYHLDLHGPAVCFDTACSSSLVAVHFACHGIKNGDCDIAIVGGINIRVLPIGNAALAGIESADAITRTYDINGDGTGTGEGAGVIILKSYNDAVRDRDNIYAIIKGSAVNQDGKSFGITAPNSDAQTDVIVKAWESSGIDPETVSYIETHGTATKLGDPIEIQGIKKAFGKYTNKKQFVAISSIKTNMGHLIGAAGIAGFTKAVLSLKHKKLPPNINLQRPNPTINFIDSPAYIVNELTDWHTNEKRRRCGVSSFGISGTNCHIVLEEVPEETVHDKDNMVFYNVLTMSAKHENNLLELVKDYYKALEDPNINLTDFCYTANIGREHFKVRLAIAFKTRKELKKGLNQIIQVGILPHIDGVYYSGATTKSMHTKAANRQLDLFKKSHFKEILYLKDLCELYVCGSHIDWKRLYDGLLCKRISIPAYPFSRTRCWMSIANDHLLSDLFYCVKWRISEYAEAQNSKENAVIVFEDKKGICTKINEHYRKNKTRVFTVSFGNLFKKNNDCFTIQNNKEDFNRLLAELKSESIDKIIFLSDHSQEIAGTDEPLVDRIHNQSNNTMALFHLAKSVVSNEMIDKLDIVIIARYANEVTGSETNIYPENAAMFGLAKVIEKEQLNVNCKCIDVDDDTDIAAILKDIKYVKKNEYIAYRCNMRHEKEIDKANIPDAESIDLRIQDNGVYLITGGLGGLGLEMANYLASINSCHIVLVNRTSFPPRDMWDEIVENKLGSYGLINKIRDIELTGARISIRSADISNYNQMETLILSLRDEYKFIRGVIHAAGVGGDGFIFNKDESIFLNTLQPKIAGTYILDNLLQDDEIDFFICFSSIASVTAPMGQGDYVAANSYLDAFQSYRNKLGRRTVTVNWTGWREVGMAKKFGVVVDGIFKDLSTRKAMKAFDCIFNKKINNVIVGELQVKQITQSILEDSGYKMSDDLKERIIGKQSLTETNKPKWKEEKLVRVVGNGSLTNEELILGQVWGQVLGEEEMDIFDNFYEMGGNSISAVNLEAKLEQKGIFIKANNISQYPTIHLMAQQIQKISSKNMVLSHIEPFNELYFKNCFFNSFFPVIKYFDKSVLSFIINEIPVYSFEAIDGENTLSIEYHQYETILSLLKKVGLKATLKEKSSNIVKDIINSIENGNPVIIWVDCFYESFRKDMYLKKHWPHTLLIYGFDYDKSVFYTIEHLNSQNLNYEKLEIGFEECEKVYAGYLENFDYSQESPTFYSFSPDQTETESLALITEALRNYIKYKDKIRDSIQKLPSIVSYLENLLLDQEALKLEIEKIITSLNDIIKAKKIEQYKLMLLFSQYPGLIELHNEIAEIWEYVRGVLVKYLFTKTYKLANLESCVKKLQKIYDLEHNYFLEICNLAEAQDQEKLKKQELISNVEESIKK